MRCYLSHFHGGGYSDLKHWHTDWQPYFEQLVNGPEDMYAMGYFEITFPYPVCREEPGEVACSVLKAKGTADKFMGAAAFIFKPRTPLSTEWYRRLTKVMDDKYEQLKQNPATTPRDVLGNWVNGLQSKYPFRW